MTEMKELQDQRSFFQVRKEGGSVFRATRRIYALPNDKGTVYVDRLFDGPPKLQGFYVHRDPFPTVGPFRPDFSWKEFEEKILLRAYKLGNGLD